jgi:hypothetical protein
MQSAYACPHGHHWPATGTAPGTCPVCGATSYQEAGIGAYTVRIREVKNPK